MKEIVYEKKKAVEMMNLNERFLWKKYNDAEQKYGEDDIRTKEALSEWSGCWTIMQLLEGKAVQYSNGDIGEIG